MRVGPEDLSISIVLGVECGGKTLIESLLKVDLTLNNPMNTL